MDLCKLDGFDRIYCTDTFWDEYKALFGKGASIPKQYLNKLYTNLTILDQRGSIKMPNFEALKGAPGLYCIRHVSAINPRVIFFIDAGNDFIILLCSFVEKASSDYTAAITRAQSILKLLEA